ncbi:ABC transporter permease [bacterium]|nr:ABC transporter permease [bacterium]
MHFPQIKSHYLSLWILKRLIDPDKAALLHADFEQLYLQIRDDEGRCKALKWYIVQFIYSLIPIVRRNMEWSFSMIQTYVKIAFRNMQRQRIYTILNIGGLAVGLGMALIILLWVNNEMGFDRFHENAENLYRVVVSEILGGNEEVHFTSTAAPLGPELHTTYPEFLDVARVGSISGVVIGIGDDKNYERRIDCVDPAFFDIFTYPFIHGTPETALIHPHSLVLTESTAKRYFGSSDVLDRMVRINSQWDYKITGVIKDIPGNSHFTSRGFIPFKTLEEFGANLDRWDKFSYSVYAELVPDVDLSALNQKIHDHIRLHNENTRMTLSMQSLLDIHLHSNNIWGYGGRGDIRYLIIFSSIALFLLVAACINFMNLATARAARRAKEVALRKTVGADRSVLVRQFFGESILITLIALVLAIIIAGIALPYFNQLAGQSLTFVQLIQWKIIVGIIGISIFTGLLAGTYPALFLSAFQPAKVLNGAVGSGARHSVFRRILVSVQFILTIGLLTSTFIINRQMKFVSNQKLGFDKERVLVIRMAGAMSQHSVQIKNALMQNPQIMNISLCSNLPDNLPTSVTVNDWEGREGDFKFNAHTLTCDADMDDVLKLQMTQGRFFSNEIASDSSSGMIINEATLRVLGIEEPLGKQIMGSTIIGVVKDFHYSSLHEKIGPLLIDCTFLRKQYLAIRLRPGTGRETIESIKSVIQDIIPNQPVGWNYLDDRIDELYQADRRIGSLINVFTVLIIFVAALGLLGLASFTAESRAKEMSIRKVLGASSPVLFSLLSWEFIRWILLANIIAWPIAYMLMQRWLQNFAYRTSLDAWIFIAASLAAVIMALATVSYQVIRSVNKNPAEVLRKE